MAKAINTTLARTTTVVDEMEMCARDKNPDVRYSLTLNPEAPQEIIGLLIEDPDPDVREAARSRFSGSSSQFDKYDTSYAGKPTLFMVTTNDIPGGQISQTLGLVSGASSKMALGLNKQSERLDLALNSALMELEQHARVLGANAVVALQIAANSSQGASAPMMGSSDGVIVIGTAVIAEFN